MASLNETTVNMTLTDLCKAVSEEMGIEVLEDDYLGYPYSDPVQWLATGDGMLKVLGWLIREKGLHTITANLATEEHFNVELVIGPYLIEKKGFSDTFPTAVLLAFMKAVKGIGVELVDGGVNGVGL